MRLDIKPKVLMLCCASSSNSYIFDLKGLNMLHVEFSRIQTLRRSLGTICSDRRRKWQPTPVFLPGESQGRGNLVGCRLWGRTELDTTEVTLQQQQC